jgi:hypothetical protein
MSERIVKTHVLANTDLSSILEPDEFTSRPAECKGELRHALTAAVRFQITKQVLPCIWHYARGEQHRLFLKALRQIP